MEVQPACVNLQLLKQAMCLKGLLPCVLCSSALQRVYIVLSALCSAKAV